MIVVKRYPNRKLYNTNAKKYITLDGVAQLIREGEEVQILDHSTGEDLTAVTFTQIIFEQEKKEGGFLPRSVLTSLVQSGGETLSTLRRSLASPLNLRFHVNSEIQRRIDALVESGELTEEESQQMSDKLLGMDSTAPEANLPTEDDIEQLLKRQGLPTRDDINELNLRLDEIVAKLDEDNETQPK